MSLVYVSRSKQTSGPKVCGKSAGLADSAGGKSQARRGWLPTSQLAERIQADFQGLAFFRFFRKGVSGRPQGIVCKHVVTFRRVI